MAGLRGVIDRVLRRATPSPVVAPVVAPVAAPVVAPVAAPEGFDEQAYLDAHPDVREAVAGGAFASGRAHFEAFGRQEGRVLRLRMARNIAELDAEIERLRELAQRSAGEWLRGRATFTFFEECHRLPADALSPEYRETQLALYREISGATSYDAWAAEPCRIPIAGYVDPTPYPFNTRDAELIGGHLIAVGHLMQALGRSKPGDAQTLLEYGCGTGVTTVVLAAAGYRVTAVDINADALAIVDAIAAGRRLTVRTHHGAFGSVPVEQERFDVILFYEAFHHSLDFMALLQKLPDRLADGGILVFAQEPIFRVFPKPWGLRLDGASLWEIRTKGWLELGFREDFFLDVLARTGWRSEKLTLGSLSQVYVARRDREMD